MSETTPPPPRGGDRREEKNKFMSERVVMDIPTFLEKFQTTTTDQEKLLLVAALLENVAVEYSENQDSQESREAIYNAFTHLASQVKENS